MPYRIFTDATADLTPKLLEGLPPVEIIPMQIEIGDREYSYGSAGNITTQEFYRMRKFSRPRSAPSLERTPVRVCLPCSIGAGTVK